MAMPLMKEIKRRATVLMCCYIAVYFSPHYLPMDNLSSTTPTELLSTTTPPAATNPIRAQWDIDNCTILGRMFNFMEDQIYHMFLYCDTVPSLWQTLSQMYAHAHNDARILKLYQDIAQASQSSLGLSVAEFFGYLQACWEELAQYELLTNLPPEAAFLMSKRLARQHTYQFLMGLNSEFESLRIQNHNTSPMPSLYEAYATIDSDERHR
ncbi:uncharacterized protein LOC114317794 [Camellia sinensis]|uniref:uncharacterized protein LOC114317794 n=1 Tax=Camellia sinensis TaxID=4442 RepID=UPI001035C5A4|nr:uncharacterized protein LOC114317794 [Camellia sinensis]